MLFNPFVNPPYSLQHNLFLRQNLNALLGIILAKFSTDANVDSSQFDADYHVQSDYYFEFCCDFNVHCQHVADLFPVKVENFFNIYYLIDF